jgi:hypothetical protein
MLGAYPSDKVDGGFDMGRKERRRNALIGHELSFEQVDERAAGQALLRSELFLLALQRWLGA